MSDVIQKPLSRRRIWLAFTIAIAADATQVLLGPVGFAFFDQIIDVITMCAMTFLIGFHPLFLPTFVLELMPMIDMFPTWTGCVVMVVALRRKARPVAPPPVVRADPKVIDI